MIEFAKKHDCEVLLSTHHNSWFEGVEAYKNIKFITPGDFEPCHAMYRIGWFKNDEGLWKDFSKLIVVELLPPSTNSYRYFRFRI